MERVPVERVPIGRAPGNPIPGGRVPAERAPGVRVPTRGEALPNYRPDIRRDGPPTDSSDLSPRIATPRAPDTSDQDLRSPIDEGLRTQNPPHHDDRRHRGHHGGYGRHDVYVNLFGGYDYRYLDRYPYYTNHYYRYRYCNGYYGDPYYYSTPFGHYGYSRLGLYFGFRGYYPYDPYYGYYGPPVEVVIDGGQAEGRSVGALDINVRPKDTEVFLNGHYVGTTGNYDGYPQFLWLEEGEYELIFYKAGFETERRIYDVRTGLQIDIGFQMKPGEAVDPETLSHRSVPPESFGVPEEGEEGSDQILADAVVGAEGEPGPIDAREVPGRVRVTVEPVDASVYVDGRFVGTGQQVSGAQGAILVDAGRHVIEVVHPAYEAQSVRFEVDAGQELEVEVPALTRSRR